MVAVNVGLVADVRAWLGQDFGYPGFEEVSIGVLYMVAELTDQLESTDAAYEKLVLMVDRLHAENVKLQKELNGLSHIVFEYRRVSPDGQPISGVIDVGFPVLDVGFSVQKRAVGCWVPIVGGK